jgi:hypothetical protein
MRAIYLLLCLLAAIPCCFAQGGQTYDGKVVFLAQAARQPINPFTAYRSSLNYFIAADVRAMTFEVDEHSYSIDMEQVTKEAIAEWQRALGTSLIFAQVNSEAAADLIVNISGTGNLPVKLGSSAPRSARDSRASLTYYWRGFQAALSDPNYRSSIAPYIEAGGTPVETTQNVLRFLARMVAKHEIGHVLGFDHPELSATGDQPSRSPGHVVVFENHPNPTIPIMTARSTDYIRSLFAATRRPVRAEDIYISTQEQAALAELERDTRNHCSCCLPRRSRQQAEFLQAPNPLAQEAICPSFRYIPRYNPAALLLFN